MLDYNSNQTEINFGNSVQPRTRMLNEIIQMIGPLVTIPSTIRKIFSKVSVIYSREQEIPENPFLNSILTNLNSEHKKIFPKYEIQRLEGLIWSTREEFCRYYRTLEWEVYCKRLEGQKNWSELANFCDSKKDEWSDFLQEYTGHVTGISWLKVYSSGHVLTRIMELGVTAYFRLKEYQIEVELLQSLISQNVFLTEHKGRWYDELTKITDLYLDKSLARQLCLEALSDKCIIASKKFNLSN